MNQNENVDASAAIIQRKALAIVGGGPSGLFLLKRLLKSNVNTWAVHVFEKSNAIGPGMPYSEAGAGDEHVTNVSDNEIPELITDIREWILRQPADLLKRFNIDATRFNEFKVLPRLLFGKYLQDQFKYIVQAAQVSGLSIKAHYNSEVVDIVDQPKEENVKIQLSDGKSLTFHQVIISTGHFWPAVEEKNVPHYFNSPYPPSKLKLTLNHPVALRGASLSAIDAIKTIARANGTFAVNNSKLCYTLAPTSPDLKIVLHSRNGLLPAFRFHLSQSSPSSRILLTEQEIADNRSANDGFLSLDYVFDTKYKAPLEENDPEFYAQVKDMSLEEFTTFMLTQRQSIDPFDLFKAEYTESEKSIKRKASIYWKESLAELSYIINYPAKYFSAEDMIRLKEVLMPLISVVIAFVPQSSGLELLALHDAGVLSLKEVGDDSRVEAQPEGGARYFMDNHDDTGVYYKTFVDCIGQQRGTLGNFPFKGLIGNGTAAQAKLRFKEAEKATTIPDDAGIIEKDTKGVYYMHVPGVAINDQFQLVDEFGAYNSRIFIMAVPFISGYYPDYSGLDFCEQASERIVNYMLKHQ